MIVICSILVRRGGRCRCSRAGGGPSASRRGRVVAVVGDEAWRAWAVRVLVHAVQKPLDDAEGDETADVDVGKFRRVLQVPLLDALALLECGVQFDQANAIDDSRPPVR